MSEEGKVPFLEFAPKWVMYFCGSLVAISLAAVQIGFDDVIDAYAQSIIMELEHTQECEKPVVIMDTSFLEERILLNETAIGNLEALSHPKSIK